MCFSRKCKMENWETGECTLLYGPFPCERETDGVDEDDALFVDSLERRALCGEGCKPIADDAPLWGNFWKEEESHGPNI